MRARVLAALALAYNGDVSNRRAEEGVFVKSDYYSISEMAALFGLTRQTLIYYDRLGLFRPACVNDEGYRLYAPTQIPLLRLICLLRSMGIELKEIARVLETSDPTRIAECLVEQIHQLDGQIDALRARCDAIRERLDFYESVSWWKGRADRPTLRHYGLRRVLYEPFAGDGNVDRTSLHPSLMRLVARMRDACASEPICGWGTLLFRDAVEAGRPLEGAGPFVVVPPKVDTGALGDICELPEGIYLCYARWGMPYDPTGVRILMDHVKAHRLKVIGDVFDFCLMDATCYDAAHQEDFCCLQVPVEL